MTAIPAIEQLLLRPGKDGVESESSRPSLGFRPQLLPQREDGRKPSEIVLGIVGPLGTDGEKLRRMISERLKAYRYTPQLVSISGQIIPSLAAGVTIPESPKYERAKLLIDLGDQIRSESKNNGILAVAAADRISQLRGKDSESVGRNAYIVSSLKRPEEVAELRRIYAGGFYLFAVHTDAKRRLRYLMHEGEGMFEARAKELLARDEHEVAAHGQRTRDTFHLADFFLADENNEDRLRFSVWRSLDLIFANPTLTPTFNEFAMFMAFSSSLRSADLSRQVGAVVTKEREILSMGANDCPSAGGGLYWPRLSQNRVEDVPDGRDYTRGYDSNSREKARLIKAISSRFTQSVRKRLEEVLRNSPISDITEYGRMVHAEMEALLACARSNVSCVGARLFCTTFPCHNCAKHIIAAGIREVVYVEPYPKSKALEFHHDAVSTTAVEKGDKRVRFRPFVGVGPRQFFDLFSMQLSAGRPVVRRSSDGKVIPWKEDLALPRVQMLPASYLDFEQIAAEYLDRLTARKGSNE